MLNHKYFLALALLTFALIQVGCTKTEETTQVIPDATVSAIDETQTSTDESQTVSEEESQQTAEERTLIERNQVAQFKSELPDPCAFDEIDALHFSDASETEWVAYSNPEKGLEVSIPFNPTWGAPKYQLKAYGEDEKGIVFGNINLRGEGCGAWVAGTQRLDFIPTESKEAVLERLQKESDALEFGYAIKSLTVGDKDVVEYTKDGMCGGGGTIVIGKKYNYELSTTCGPNTREDLIKTMKFVD